jgi:error-prone DNA polymerase
MDKTYLLRRHGAEQVTYLHPRLKDALRETLGVILYQEQVLKVAHDLAGMSYAEADGFRRAMTHDRTRGEMEKMRSAFVSCAVNGGVSKDIAEKVFEQLAAFAAYGFCKAHAISYALLAYQTLWLKHHYPAEFFASLLSNQPMGYYPPRVLLDDAKKCGVSILPVDVNRSCEHYVVENGGIRVSLLQLKGMTGKAVKAIISERARREFDSLDDFIVRTGVSRSIVNNLINVGAFESIERKSLLNLSITAQDRVRYALTGKSGPLFVYDTPELARDKALRRTIGESAVLIEWELLSFSISAHPLDFHHFNKEFVRIKDIRFAATGSTVKIVGSVIRYQTPPTRNGNRVVYVIMEDGTGVADVTVFGDVQEKCGQVLFRVGWLIVKGKVQRRGPKAVSIIAEYLCPLSLKR